jgi:hypothetical protein
MSLSKYPVFRCPRHKAANPDLRKRRHRHPGRPARKNEARTSKYQKHAGRATGQPVHFNEERGVYGQCPRLSHRHCEPTGRREALPRWLAMTEWRHHHPLSIRTSIAHTASRSRGVFRPSFASTPTLSKERAQGRPGAGWHPWPAVRSNAHAMHNGKTTGGPETTRPSLRSGFTAYARSPRRRILVCPRHQRIDGSSHPVGSMGPPLT